MNWIESLYETYQNCESSVGDINDTIPLVPTGHIVQQTHIEITISGDGKIRNAKVDPFATIIPCTESSAGRTNAPEAHPLSDKLKYICSDYYELTGEKPSKKAKKIHHEEFINLLGSWVSSAHSHPKLKAIANYLEANNGAVLKDLCRFGIYPISDEGRIQKKWSGDKDNPPPIYSATKNYPAPWDIFVRWRVEAPGELEDRTYFDRALWDCWIKFYRETVTTNGFCHATGETSYLASQHPKRIRSIADGAKLISSNDSSGFTFRGRFTDSKGDQVCGVGFDITQKAHAALRWLVARQGHRDGDQVIVAWATSGKDIPPLIETTDGIVDEEDFLSGESDGESDSIRHVEVAQDFAQRLNRKIAGYRADLGATAKIVVLALDSATPGRLSITFYRELFASEFLARIERWHLDCAWHQNYSKDKKFIGAPAPKDIAVCAYGKRLDSKLQASTQRRLIPCILENAPVPRDLVESCVNRATARLSLEHWEWEKALGIACALYRKQQIQTNQHKYSMALERDRKTRDYLYGRLLAVADLLEGAALSGDEKRATNAARFMQRFADYPYSTWRSIELSLVPSRRILQANSPGLLFIYDKELQEIMDGFAASEFELDEKLKGEFLLAYHCQRTALWTKKSDGADKEPTTTLIN
ncbi:MAG: type I-C CRISPR-associated protein Cas8c/Csd1 [Verrucomicrobiales bacterium]|nr:type I-C CRISPR-associated protein Cas8c/Csd1 [Verrucomicrobiales bacterium]